MHARKHEGTSCCPEVVKVRVPTSARTSRVMVAVDGKALRVVLPWFRTLSCFCEAAKLVVCFPSMQDRIELKRGDSIEVAVSPYPLPTICRSSATWHNCIQLPSMLCGFTALSFQVTKDWFRSVNEALQWNLRLVPCHMVQGSAATCLGRSSKAFALWELRSRKQSIRAEQHQKYFAVDSL